MSARDSLFQCAARRVHPYSSDYFIRCTQPEGHDGSHALYEPDSDDELTVWTDESRYSLPPATDRVAYG